MRHRSEKNFVSYFLPFFIFLALGVIIALIVQLFMYFFASERDLSKVDLYLFAGRAQMRQWGSEDWKDVSPGTSFWEGDEIMTFGGSRLLVNLGSDYLLLGDNAHVLFTSLDGDNYLFELKKGKVASAVKERDIDFQIDDVLYHPEKSHFFLEKNEIKGVRVISGGMDLSYIESSDNFYDDWDEIEVNSSQELIYNKLKPTPLQVSLIDPSFLETDWFKWNDAFVEKFYDSNDPIELMENAGDLIKIEKPIITVSSHEDAEIIKFQTIDIYGKASSNVEKITVKSFTQWGEDIYVLNKYQKGDGQWKYRASFQYENFGEGENIYEIVGIDSYGNESTKQVLKLIYDNSVV